jgi:hypothetical protein
MGATFFKQSIIHSEVSTVVSAAPARLPMIV